MGSGVPMSALAHVDIDYSLPAARPATLIARLVAEPAGPTPDAPLELRIEAATAQSAMR